MCALIEVITGSDVCIISNDELTREEVTNDHKMRYSFSRHIFQSSKLTSDNFSVVISGV